MFFCPLPCPVAHIRQPSLGVNVDKQGFDPTFHELAAHSELWHFLFFFAVASCLENEMRIQNQTLASSVGVHSVAIKMSDDGTCG